MDIVKELREFLKEYRKTNDILDYLKTKGIEINSRKWQDIVLEYNAQYPEHESYIAGNSKGYILTYDKEKIKQANFQKIKKAVSMIRNAKKDLNELGLKNQISFIDTQCDQIEKLIDQVEIVNRPQETKYVEQPMRWY